MNARRWPPAGPGGTDPLAMEPDWCAQLRSSLGDMSDALRHFTPTPVLGSATYLLNAAGQAADQYRTPYRALAVTSASASQLILTSAPPQSSAPGPGPGSAIIPPRGFVVVNMGPGYDWTIYGGTLGEQVSVQAFTTPQMAQAENGPLLAAQLGNVTTQAFPAASTAAYATVNGPAAGGLIVATPVLPAGLYSVTVYPDCGGTTASVEANNVELLQGATVIGTLMQSSVTAAAAVAQTFVVQMPGGTALSVNAVVAGTSTASYRASIIATMVNPS